MIIIGAGMAGLLAANMIRDSQIIEAQSALPNNHSAVLRFRTAQVGDVLGIPFKKVTLIKTTLPWKNPVADALSYSYKNMGVRRSDRSIISGMTVAERFIAPPDLIEWMAERVHIEYDSIFNGERPILTPPPGNILPFTFGKLPYISTIPMPTLMQLLDYPNMPDFSYQPGTNLRAILKNTDAYVTLSVPDPNVPFSRISITGNELIIEIPGDYEPTSKTRYEVLASLAIEMLGLPSVEVMGLTSHKQQYAKVNPIDETVRKEFIYWATDKHNIFSLGRFATWRPNLLMDDLVQDVRLIERWSRDRYEAKARR